MIPKTFEQWKDCIVNNCKINLTKAFVQERLAVYQDLTNQETQRFISVYGEQHWQNIIHWLKQV